MGLKEVTAGAAWLDENFPGWEREIDLGTLNLRSCSSCVLGQSLREFTTSSNVTGFGVGEEWLEEDELGMEDFTFAFVCSEYEPMWRELIKERFSSGNLSDAG